MVAQLAEMTAEIAVLKRQRDAKCEADKVEMDTEMAMLTQNSKVICPRAITQISMRPTVLHTQSRHIQVRQKSS